MGPLRSSLDTVVVPTSVLRLACCGLRAVVPQHATQGMEVREGALEALRQSQQQLQEELRDAMARLQLVDRSTGRGGRLGVECAGGVGGGIGEGAKGWLRRTR
jgi:hypothetical protein